MTERGLGSAIDQRLSAVVDFGHCGHRSFASSMAEDEKNDQ
jgi:hypothetical protein